MAKFKLEDVNNVSLSAVVKRQFNPTDLSLVHAMYMLLVGPAILFYELSQLENYESSTLFDYFMSTSSLFQVFYGISFLYFVFDTIMIFVNAMRRNGGKLVLAVMDYGYLFHHFVCLSANWGPLVLGKDGVLVFIAYFIGELSNPPRGLADMVQAELKQMREVFNSPSATSAISSKTVDEQSIRKSFATMIRHEYLLVQSHWFSFLVMRVVGALYMIFGTAPYCQALTTDITGWLITVFSLGSVVFLIIERKANAKTYHIHCDPFAKQD